MTQKRIILILLSGSLLFIVGLALMLSARPVQAQCGPGSTCRNCHETQGQKPVSGLGAWHIDHAPFGYCVPCHSGNNQEQAKEKAHAGLLTRYDQMGGSCKVCHGKDLDEKLLAYAGALNVSDISGMKNSQGTIAGTTSGGLDAFLGVQAPVVPAAGEDAPAPSAPEKPQNETANIVLGVLLAAGVFGGGAYVAWNERRLRQANGPRAASVWLALLKKEQWSPYLAGVLLGVTGILAVLLANRTLGASSAIATIASSGVNAAAPEAAANSMYFKFIMPPGFNWEVALLIGVFFGSLLSALSSGTFKLRWNDDPTWNKVFGPRRWKRFVFGFLGAVILQIGAGIAGGCTSGLAISGGMLLAPSAFLFMAGMFASGILVAVLVFRGRY